MNEESLIACFACAIFSFCMLRTVFVSQGVKGSQDWPFLFLGNLSA